MFKGSVKCHGDKVKNANCPKDQYMVVKFAAYRGLLAPKKCGSSDDYDCEIDVTCLVKKQCDGLLECSIMVDDKLFSLNKCPGLSNYIFTLNINVLILQNLSKDLVVCMGIRKGYD